MLVADHTALGDPYQNHEGAICAGSRLSSTETVRAVEMARSAKRAAGRIALVEPFRGTAAIALDAALEGRRELALDIRILCRVALAEYRVRHPGAHAPYVFKAMPRRNLIRVSTGRVDLYCRFCGVLLMLDVDRHAVGSRTEHTGPVAAHAVPCALKHLAFSLVPVAPEFVRLPEEMIEGEPDAAEATT
ncbi:MAG: hypothetical protein H0T89_31270 [Deltaproteobacteria bacterium]|nr:hypothetical protein [Deltaproteobacteria bacterium]